MRTKKSVVNILVGVISLVITTILGFILSKVFINNVGIEKNGLNSLFSNILAILSISELGIAGAINYNLYKPILENDYEKVSIIMKFYRNCYRVIGSLILILSLIMSLFIEQFISGSTIGINYIKIAFIIYAINCSSTYFFAYYRNLFYGYQQVYIASIVDLIVKVFRIFLQIFLLIKYESYILYLLVNIIFDVLANVIIHIVAKKRFDKINIKIDKDDVDLKKKVMKDVKSLSVIQVTNAMINFTDSILISKFVGIFQTGLYANYKMIINQLNNFINTIFNALGGSIGNLLAEDSKDSIGITLYNLEYFCFFLGIVCMNGLIALMQPFIIFWLGSEYLISFGIVIVIAINLYIMVQRQVITYFLRTGGYHDRMLKVSVIEAIMNFGISILLVFKLGILGVLLGTLVSAIYGIIFNSKILYDIYKLNYKKYLGRQFKMFLLAILVGLLLMLISEYLVCSVLLNLVIMGFIYMVMVVVLILLVIFCNKKLSFYKDNMMKIFKYLFRKRV